MRFIIVKRGALSTFRFLERSCKDIADLRVMWDRRRGPDRRAESSGSAQERRQEDRRRAEPHSWVAADHVLAECADEALPFAGTIKDGREEQRRNA